MRAYFQLLGLFALSLGLSVTLGDRECECDYKRTWLDIVIVVDSSKEMNVQDFYAVRNFASAVAKQVNISQETGAYSRIGFINGGVEAKVVADLTTFKSSIEAADAIHKITYMNADNFNLRKSLLAAANMVEKAYKQRPNVKKLVIVFSGKSEDCVYQGKFQMKMVKPEEDQNPCRIASHIKENGGVVMTVGLKYDGANTFPHMKFGSECYRLDFDDQFARHFLRKLCDANCFCNAPFVQFTDPKDKCHKFGECVYQQGQPLAYETASETCVDYETKVTEILSPQKDAFLKDLAGKYGYHSLWLGATGVDGHYTWTISGEAVSGYQPWAQGQPNVHDGNCAYEDVDSGKWSAAKCDNIDVAHYYSCQKISCDTNNYCNMPIIQH